MPTTDQLSLTDEPRGTDVEPRPCGTCLTETAHMGLEVRREVLGVPIPSTWLLECRRCGLTRLAGKRRGDRYRLIGFTACCLVTIFVLTGLGSFTSPTLLAFVLALLLVLGCGKSPGPKKV